MSETKERKQLSAILHGKGILNPHKTGRIDERVQCIREYGVNLYFYQKGNDKLMIDTGYLEYPLLPSKLESIGINPNEIKSILLTHADPDHAGGIDDRGDMLFSKAEVYIGEKENLYVKHVKCRKLLHLKPIRRPKISNTIIECKDGVSFQIGEIEVMPIYVPGHTMGHMCYLIDGAYLFSGDCINLIPDGGYSFMWFLNVSSRLNRKSLIKLKQQLSNCNLKLICTGHGGVTKDKELFFRHINKQLSIFFRRRSYNSNAPFDLYAKEEK